MRVLFFAPHAAIWVHAFPEALVAEALQQQGHDVVYIGCGRLFERFCVAMSAHAVGFHASSEERGKVCDQCVRNDHLLRGEFDFKGRTLRELMRPEDLEIVERELANPDREALLALERDGVALGRVALYQLMIRKKKLDLNFDDEDWAEYLMDLRHTLYSWRASLRLLDAYRPDRVIVYNGLYPVNRAACLLAEARNIPAYFIHAGGNLANRLQTLMLARGNTFTYYPKLLRQWLRFANVPCTPSVLSAVTDHYVALFNAQSVFVYSAKRSRVAFDSRSYFGITSQQKILVAIMSSYDEEVAAELAGARVYSKPKTFATQTDWIAALIDFAEEHPEVFLIIRVHPREFSNRRDDVTSQHAGLLREMLQNLPRNAAVNWPSDGVSLYDLIDQVDVFLNAWSSVGKEMALLGFPVVIYSDELPFYPADMNYFGDTRNAYFDAVLRALADGWRAENIRKAYRWAAFEFVHSTIDISAGYPRRENARRSLVTRARDRVRRALNRDFQQHQDMKVRARFLPSAGRIAEALVAADDTIMDRIAPESLSAATVAEETAGLRRELARLARALFPTRERRSQSRLYARLTDAALFN